MDSQSKLELIYLHGTANQIFHSDKYDWEEKYDLIFSDKISKKIGSIIHISYCDPDTTYEEDLKAYMDALNSKVETLDLFDNIDTNDIPVSKKELIECIQNLIGIFDNPIAKQKIDNDLANEAREIGRNILKRIEKEQQ